LSFIFYKYAFISAFGNREQEKRKKKSHKVNSYFNFRQKKKNFIFLSKKYILLEADRYSRLDKINVVEMFK